MTKGHGQPVYSKIAFDLAVKIASGELREGTKITGRSLMGTQYKASPETIRRALWHLNDVGVISTQDNVGSTVVSRSHAVEYVEHRRLDNDLLALRARLDGMIAARDELNRDIDATLGQILELNQRFRDSDRLHMFTFKIGGTFPALGVSIRDFQFRQKTGATIVAIRRDDETILSPEPSTEFKVNDVLIVACGVQHIDKVRELMEDGVPKARCKS